MGYSGTASYYCRKCGKDEWDVQNEGEFKDCPFCTGISVKNWKTTKPSGFIDKTNSFHGRSKT